MAASFYIDHSMDLEVTNFRLAHTAAYITDAELTAKLIDEYPDGGGAESVLETITLSYESGTDADYYGFFSGDTSLTEGKNYIIRIESTNYDNLLYEIEVVAKRRRV